VYWKDALEAFAYIHSVTVPDKTLPLISKQAESKNQKDTWDYSGRLWFFYSSIIASAFGWSTKQIASLSVREALAYVQEILTDKQLEREFAWSTTEVAYSYDKQTKKSKFVSLSRPYWMLPDIDEKKGKVVRIPKSLLPVGTIITIDERKNEIEKAKSTRDN